MTQKELIKAIRKIARCSKKKARKLIRLIDSSYNIRHKTGDISPAVQAWQTVRNLKRSMGIPVTAQFYPLPENRTNQN